MKRLFAAIRIQPDETLTALYWSMRNALKDERITWVDPGNMHITLKFFGETPEHHIPGISIALREAGKASAPFTLSLKNTGVFGSSYKPRVVWFGIDPSDALTALAGNVKDRLEDIGITGDRQNFVQHLTAGRIKSLSDKKHFQRVMDNFREAEIKKEEVESFHLFESILKPQGPEYIVLQTFMLEKS